jgi:hypothetical protein
VRSVTSQYARSVRLSVLPIVAITIVFTAAVVFAFAVDGWGGGHISEFFADVAVGLIPVVLAVAFVALVYLAVRFSPNAGLKAEISPEPPRIRWLDEPVDLDEIDEFDRLPFVDRLLEIISTTSAQRSSSVIALSGPWGSGKSSVLKTVTRRLMDASGEGRTLVASVNPWRYPSADSLVHGIFAEIRAAIPRDARWSDAGQRLADVLSTAEPFGALSAPLGLDGSRFLGLAAARLRKLGSATNAHDRADSALRALRIPIVVVVDDIDRLGPQELLSLFRAIRLLGRLPYVHYVLTMDVEVVADLLRRTDLVGKRRSSAYRYLEKMIQYRLDLPALRQVDVDRIVNDAVEGALTAGGVALTRDREQELAFVYQAEIGPRLDSPRIIQKWIAHFAIPFPALARDVDFVDFVIFTWLKVAYPKLPSVLLKHKGTLFRSDDLASHLNRPDGAERDRAWRSWIKSAGVPADDVERVYSVLARLFPEVAKAQSRSSDGADLRGALRRRGIGHPDFFHRYFALAVPRDEISESQFDEEVSHAAKLDSYDTTSRLALSLRLTGRSVVERVENWVENHPDQRLGIIRWLAINYHDADHSDLFSPQQAIRGSIFRLVSEHGVVDAITTILNLPSDRALHIGALALSDAARDTTGSESVAHLIQDTVGRIAQHLSSFDVSPEALTSADRELLWLWRALDQPSVRDWFQGMVADKWSLVEGVAAILGTSRTLGVPEPVVSLTGLDHSSIEAFLGESWLREELSSPDIRSELAGDALEAGSWRHTPDTWQNRLAVARWALRQFTDD